METTEAQINAAADWLHTCNEWVGRWAEAHDAVKVILALTSQGAVAPPPAPDDRLAEGEAKVKDINGRIDEVWSQVDKQANLPNFTELQRHSDERFDAINARIDEVWAVVHYITVELSDWQTRKVMVDTAPPPAEPAPEPDDRLTEVERKLNARIAEAEQRISDMHGDFDRRILEFEWPITPTPPPAEPAPKKFSVGDRVIVSSAEKAHRGRVGLIVDSHLGGQLHVEFAPWVTGIYTASELDPAPDAPGEAWERVAIAYEEAYTNERAHQKYQAGDWERMSESHRRATAVATRAAVQAAIDARLVTPLPLVVTREMGQAALEFWFDERQGSVRDVRTFMDMLEVALAAINTGLVAPLPLVVTREMVDIARRAFGPLSIHDEHTVHGSLDDRYRRAIVAVFDAINTGAER